MKPSELSQLLAHTIPAGMPVLIVGSPGIGKSDIVAQACRAAESDIIISHPAVADPTDAKGLPWPVPGEQAATFLPFGDLAQAMRATRRTVWMLDDLGQATPAVQASYMQLLLARRCNGHVIPDCVTFVGATNRRTDRAGVCGILEPVKSRFGAIVELTADLDDWCAWAMTRDVPPMLIAYLRYRPDQLCAYSPTNDMTQSPCPRTWMHLVQIGRLGLPRDVECEAMVGAVGPAAMEYIAYRDMAQQIQSIDSILASPDVAMIPTPDQLDVLYATVTGLAARVTRANIGRVGIYATRLVDTGYGEYAVLLMRDAVRRQPDIVSTQDFVRIMCGPVGRLINGSVPLTWQPSGRTG
jgi:hypothetical protein